jgi:aminoglycoside phosphotransferase (APT) family kinase protein
LNKTEQWPRIASDLPPCYIQKMPERNLPIIWNPSDPSVLAWVEQSVSPGTRVSRVTPLPESSTAKHLIEVLRNDGSRLQLLLRRYNDAKRLAEDPWYVPSHEALALRMLADTAIPAPRLYAADLDAKVCGVPALLESWLPGEPNWNPRDLDRYLARTAEVLVAIHSVPLSERPTLPQYAPYSDMSMMKSQENSHRSELWNSVAEVLRSTPPAGQETFIHRDYHPGNILWNGAVVTGVVDWATAAVGPPGIDLARMRLNLALHHGRSAAKRFVDAYLAAGGDASARDRYWDLFDAADFAVDFVPSGEHASENFARFEEYIEEVLNELH